MSPLVRLACADDDAQGQELDVYWEYELDRRILEQEASKRRHGCVRTAHPVLGGASWRRTRRIHLRGRRRVRSSGSATLRQATIVSARFRGPSPRPDNRRELPWVSVGPPLGSSSQPCSWRRSFRAAVPVRPRCGSAVLPRCAPRRSRRASARSCRTHA